jgi:hypothetical protein
MMTLNELVRLQPGQYIQLGVEQLQALVQTMEQDVMPLVDMEFRLFHSHQLDDTTDSNVISEDSLNTEEPLPGEWSTAVRPKEQEDEI